MNRKRLIMCTSTGCIDYAPVRYKQHNIDIIRIHLSFKGKDYTEGRDLDPALFYDQLESLEDPKNNLPVTSMPTREEIEAHFMRAYSNGFNEIIVISLSSYLSGTYALLKEMARDYSDRMNITVIDSKTTCFNEGLLAIKASEMVEDGIPTEEIVKELNWMIERQEFIGVDGDLDYLIYNGRLKGGKAFIGKLLNVCPLVHFTHEGELVSLENAKTRKKALNDLCEEIKRIIGDRSSDDYLLWHVFTGRSVLEELVEIEEKYGIKTNHEDVIMSPVSGCHNGPWFAGYGLAFLRRGDECLANYIN